VRYLTFPLQPHRHGQRGVSIAIFLLEYGSPGPIGFPTPLTFFVSSTHRSPEHSQTQLCFSLRRLFLFPRTFTAGVRPPCSRRQRALHDIDETSLRLHPLLWPSGTAVFPKRAPLAGWPWYPKVISIPLPYAQARLCRGRVYAPSHPVTDKRHVLFFLHRSVSERK